MFSEHSWRLKPLKTNCWTHLEHIVEHIWNTLLNTFGTHLEHIFEHIWNTLLNTFGRHCWKHLEHLVEHIWKMQNILWINLSGFYSFSHFRLIIYGTLKPCEVITTSVHSRFLSLITELFTIHYKNVFIILWTQ